MPAVSVLPEVSPELRRNSPPTRKGKIFFTTLGLTVAIATELLQNLDGHIIMSDLTHGPSSEPMKLNAAQNAMIEKDANDGDKMAKTILKRIAIVLSKSIICLDLDKFSW